MKNKAINGLVAVILGVLFLSEIYVNIGITIYGLWLASKVLKDKEVTKSSRVISIITCCIGYPVIILAFFIFFRKIF